MIDLHCHLLPAVDDGPATTADALLLARAQAAAGVTRAATTPHVGWGWPTRPQEITERVQELRALLAAQDVPFDVVAGAEIQSSIALDIADDELGALGIGGGDWLLIEPPMGGSAVGLDRVIFELQTRGHRVLLAHPERCSGLQHDVALLERIVAGGTLTQVTAGALGGRFGSTVKRFALDIIGRGLVHCIASDAHDTVRRPPGMRAELGEAGLGDGLAWWCEQVPRAILDGGPIPRPPEPWPPRVPRARGLGRLRRG